MKIVLIGAGNLATNLGKALLAAGHDIVQVFSRTVESATALAQIAGGAPVTDIEQVRADADLEGNQDLPAYCRFYGYERL